MIYIAFNGGKDITTGGDPNIANRKLIVQDGVAASAEVINRAAFMDTVAINAYADWSSAQTIFGVNMIETQSIAAGIGPFESTGAASEFGRETGGKYCFECWVNLQTVLGFAPSSFFFSWRNASGNIFEVGTHGLTPKLRIRNGVDASIETADITLGEHFIQLNIDGNNYTLDVDGVEVYSGTNGYGLDSANDYQIQVASQTATGTATGSSTRVYVTPFRFTKGIDVPRGTIPTSLFPLA